MTITTTEIYKLYTVHKSEFRCFKTQQNYLAKNRLIKAQKALGWQRTQICPWLQFKYYNLQAAVTEKIQNSIKKLLINNIPIHKCICYFQALRKRFMFLYVLHGWDWCSGQFNQEYNFLTVTLWVLIKRSCSASSLDCDPHAKNRELDSAADTVYIYS